MFSLRKRWRCATAQQTFVGLEDVFNTFFSVTILRLPRRLEDVSKTCLEDVLKTCLEDVLKTLLEDFLKACLEDVLKTYLEDVLKTLWKQTKYSQGISVSNKSKCLSNKSIFQKSISDSSKVNPKCIN